MSRIMETLIAGFIGGVIALAVSRVEHWWMLKEQRRRLANDLAGRLDIFAIECASLIAEDRDAKADLRAAPNIPEFSKGIADADLSLLSGRIAAEIHALRANLELSKAMYRFYFSELSDPTSASDFAALECGRFGMISLELSKRIRQDVKLEQPNYDRASWNFIEVLSKEKQRYETRMKKNSELPEETK